MPQYKEVKLNFLWDKTLVRLGQNPSKWVKTPDQERIMGLLVKEMEALLSPAMAFNSSYIAEVLPSGIKLTTGHFLESPVVAELFGEAEEIVLLVYTIGPLLEEKVKGYSQKGLIVESYYLDFLGSLAVTEVGRIAYDIIEKQGKERNLKASIPLNPGTTHWPSSGQKVVLDLSGGRDIGITMSDSFILIPTKTISMAIALGKNILTPQEGSSCDYCDNPSLCWGTQKKNKSLATEGTENTELNHFSVSSMFSVAK
ncbi:MAG: hypothetical protein HY730_02500 [Candidatus Tectomicrobia bacterium]|uniref:AdoMet activation domain-containing protein n=1 Tax=Tectimicrobiota bacterium TaxID=2528274 RepID=A0A933LQ19_UNCTE|nr:hypothetical protein [Candidatus Tectomicrobia bacterium]